MARNLIVTMVVAVVMAGFVLAYTALAPAATQPSMGGGTTAAGVPAVKGYAEGMEIRFVHTEASDPQIAQTLTAMTSSPVLVVPSLAQAAPTMLANVYVFTNGLKDGGPLGFQPDVFDNPPGTEGYRPLRTVNLVTWKRDSAARELKSAAEVQDAAARGEVTVERPGVVANMPFVKWPGGQR